MGKIEETAREMIAILKYRDVTLSQISEELTYRDQSDEGMKWDNDLYEYETYELEEIEQHWDED